MIQFESFGADAKYRVPTMQNRFGRYTSFREIILLSGVFRRETASGFYPFGDATDLAGEGGVGDVVWLIQASASNHKPKEPSLWFVVYVVCLKSDMPHH